MKAGDAYTPPADSSSSHVGHTITVLDVRHHAGSYDPESEPGADYDTVDVACSCGASWSFEDRYTDDGIDR